MRKQTLHELKQLFTEDKMARYGGALYWWSKPTAEIQNDMGSFSKSLDRAPVHSEK